MDRDLVEPARNGDREAYVDLIRVRSDRLFAIAQRILRDVDRAEDALKDALVIAWRDLKGLRDPDRFDAWLQRLLIKICIAQATRERRRTANLRVLPIDRPAAPDDMLNVADRDQLRWPKPSASRLGQPALVSITPIAPCAPPSRRTLGPRSGKVDQHDSETRHRPTPGALVQRRPDGCPRHRQVNLHPATWQGATTSPPRSCATARGR